MVSTGWVSSLSVASSQYDVGYELSLASVTNVTSAAAVIENANEVMMEDLVVAVIEDVDTAMVAAVVVSFTNPITSQRRPIRSEAESRGGAQRRDSS